jgi:hypothetical protein
MNLASTFGDFVSPKQVCCLLQKTGSTFGRFPGASETSDDFADPLPFVAVP